MKRSTLLLFSMADTIYYGRYRRCSSIGPIGNLIGVADIRVGANPDSELLNRRRRPPIPADISADMPCAPLARLRYSAFPTLSLPPTHGPRGLDSVLAAYRDQAVKEGDEDLRGIYSGSCHEFSFPRILSYCCYPVPSSRSTCILARIEEITSIPPPRRWTRWHYA